MTMENETEKQMPVGSDAIVLPLSDEERAANWKALQKMHVGNRFRLMFGMPLLPEPEPAHRRMEVDLGDGGKATITGDPDMPPETAAALQKMMLALKKQAEAEGILGQNDQGQAPRP